jgi:hypothetical protein
LFEGTGNVVQESANLFWDNTNGRLGIGGTPSTNTFDIQSSSGFPKTLLAFRRPTVGDWGLSLGNETISNLYIGAVDVPATITSRYFWRASYNTAGVAANTFRPIDAALNTVPVVEIQGVLSTTAQYFSITSSGSTMGNLFNVKSTGNVLINTTTDAGFKLDVNGTARLNTIPIGLGGGQQATNTAVGITALNVNSSGTLNTAFGYTSLAFNTTGGSNTAIGFQSGYGNGTGSNNTAIGRNALITVGNYSDNTAVGAFADCVGFSGCTILGKSAVATANNQFVVGSTTTNAGAVTSEVNASTQVWNVIINGVARKILLA